MKKITILLSAAVLLAGCSKTDDNTKQNPDNALGFKSFVDRPVKALSNNQTELKQDFGVYGYWSTVGDQVPSDGLTASFMFNQQVKYGSGAFTYTPIKYWPSTGDVDFYAYTPYNSAFLTFTKPIDDKATGYPVFDYAVTPTITSQEDLLVADAEDQDGITVPSVNLVFDHALTKVAFAAKTHADYAATGAVIKVTGITISNIVNAGTFSYDSYVNAAKNTSWWSLKTTKTDYTPSLSADGGVEIKYKYDDQPDGSYKIVNGDNQYLLLIPQSFVGGTSTLTVNYTVSYGSTVEPFSKTFDLAGTKDWVSGMFITYAIDISLNMVTFTASVNTWTEATQNFIVIAEDNE